MAIRRGHGMRFVGRFLKTIPVPHFAQFECERCGAYLAEMPTSSLLTHRKSRQAEKDCQICAGRGRIREQERDWDEESDRSEPECSCVHDFVRSTWRYEWICAGCRYRHEHLSERPPEYWKPDPDVEPKPPGSFPPTEFWLVDRLLIDEVLRVAAKYVGDITDGDLSRGSLLDHDGKRHAPWGVVYSGSAEDPTGIRTALARLRHGRRDGDAARTIQRLAERAVLASAVLYGWMPRICELTDNLVTPDEWQQAERAAPVVGWGRLLPRFRYEAWLKDHEPWPWRWRNGACHREGVPTDGQQLATWIEVADKLILDFELVPYADSTVDLRNDRQRIVDDLPLWRELRRTGNVPNWPPPGLRIKSRPLRDPRSVW